MRGKGWCADDHQQALRIVLEPGLHVDAVGPEIDRCFAERGNETSPSGEIFRDS
jgi:hypothetical protein